MAVKDSAAEAAKIAIQSIGRGYDISFDLRLKFCTGELAKPLLVQIGEEQRREVLLPGGIRIPNVSKWIKCDKGERTRFRSDVLSFQQMSEHFNQELSLTGKIPSGLFNTMFQFSGCWQQDAANTKTLAFDGVFITLYTVALEKSQMYLCDYVKDAVPSTWDPAALAKFIQNFGTHVIVGMKIGGRDVIYMKQQHSSSLQPADVQKRLKILADKRFVGTDGQDSVETEQIFLNGKTEVRDQRLRFAESSSSSSYSQKEMDIVSICKRRGGNDNGNPKHSVWLHSVQSEPEVISMSFIPITSLLNGVPGSGFLSHAINLYLRYKPPIEELHQFLEFQLPRQWAPVFSDLPLGPQRKQQTTTSLQFSFMGPKLYVNTMPVEVGARPVTGLRLYLEGKRSNRLAIHLQHLSSLPKVFKLEIDPSGNFHHESYDHQYYEKVQWKNFSHVCTAPVEPDNDLSIVTAAQFQVSDYGLKKILFLRLRYSTVSGVTSVKDPQWDGSPGLARKSGLISTLISQRFTSTFTKPPPQPAEVNINSAVYPGGPPAPNQAPKLLRFVDTTEMMRGPQDSPGYWVVSGARLMVEKGRISIRVRYSLLTFIPEDDDDADFGHEILRNKNEF